MTLGVGSVLQGFRAGLCISMFANAGTNVLLRHRLNTDTKKYGVKTTSTLQPVAP